MAAADLLGRQSQQIVSLVRALICRRFHADCNGFLYRQYLNDVTPWLRLSSERLYIVQLWVLWLDQEAFRLSQFPPSKFFRHYDTPLVDDEPLDQMATLQGAYN